MAYRWDARFGMCMLGAIWSSRGFAYKYSRFTGKHHGHNLLNSYFLGRSACDCDVRNSGTRIKGNYSWYVPIYVMMDAHHPIACANLAKKAAASIVHAQFVSDQIRAHRVPYFEKMSADTHLSMSKSSLTIEEHFRAHNKHFQQLFARKTPTENWTQKIRRISCTRVGCLARMPNTNAT